MFMHNKRLQYTVRVSEPNPRLACMIMEQFGGADGELAAAMRYFTQGLGEDDMGRKDLLLDIATEELSHLEVVGSIVTMLNKGLKAQLIQMAGAQLVRRLGVPCRGDGMITSSKLNDAQAGYEGAVTLVASRASKADIVVHSIGWSEFGRAVDREKAASDEALIKNHPFF